MMLVDYYNFLQFFSKSTWKVFSYLYSYSYLLVKNDEDKMYDLYFYVDNYTITQIVGVSIPSFIKAIKELCEFNMISKKRLEVSKNITKYKINHISEINIPLDEINENNTINDIFKIIEREIELTKAINNIKINMKTTQQLKDFLEEISDLKNYMKWFISKKINTGKIKSFNIGIFTTQKIIKEYKNSWQYKKSQKAKLMGKRTIKKEKMLDNEMLMIAFESIKANRKLNVYESEVLKDAICSGDVFEFNNNFKLLIEFNELNNLSCLKKGIISNEDCLKCWQRKRKNNYLNRTDCQILKMKWKKILLELKLKKEKEGLNNNDKKVIKYLREINILKDNKLNENFIKKIKRKYDDKKI